MVAPLRRGPLSAQSSETAQPSGQRIARNTLNSAASELSSLLLFVLGFLAARLLAPEAFGQYSAAFAFVGLFRLLPDLGMSYASTIAISRDRSLAKSLIGNLLGFQVVLSAVTLALCLWLGSLLFEDVTWIAVVVLSLDLVLKGVQFTLRWLLKSFEMFGTEAIALVIERILILGAGLAALLTGQGVIGFVLAFAIVRFITASSLFAYVDRSVLALRLRWDFAVWTDLLVKGAPFAYAGAVILMFFQIDAVMLEQMRGAREVGLYSAPVRVLEGLTLIPRILGYALIPTMAALFTHDPAGVTRLYRHGLRYLLIVGLPIATFGAFASEPFIVMLFGADYAASAAASRVLLPAAIFMFLSNFAETTLACVNRWRHDRRSLDHRARHQHLVEPALDPRVRLPRGGVGDPRDRGRVLPDERRSAPTRPRGELASARGAPARCNGGLRRDAMAAARRRRAARIDCGVGGLRRGRARPRPLEPQRVGHVARPDEKVPVTSPTRGQVST